MYIWIHDKYSSTSFKQRLWQRKIVLIWQNFFFLNHVCHCGAVVKELLARADKPGSTPGDAVFGFFIPSFFFLLGRFFLNTIFPFGLFFFILTADPAGQALGSIYILSPWSAYWPSLRPDWKTISCQDMSLLSTLVDIMTNNTQYTTNCTSLHPTPISDPLAKFKLAFCTSS